MDIEKDKAVDMEKFVTEGQGYPITHCCITRVALCKGHTRPDPLSTLVVYHTRSQALMGEGGSVWMKSGT